MTPDQFAAFINGLFVNPDGSRRKALINLTITAESGQLTLEGIEVAHNDSLKSICRAYLKRMSVAPYDEQEAAEDAEPAHGGVEDVTHITHGNYEYIVFAFKDGSFGVNRQDGQSYPSGHVIYNTLVKKYRESGTP